MFSLIKTYTVSFFGHREISNIPQTEERLDDLIRRLLSEKEYVVFLIGRNGEFDQLVSSAIRRAKRTLRNDNSALVWVMPYLTAEFRGNEEAFREYYDEIEICGSSAAGYFKAAIQARNREMVDRSDFIVFYVERKKGGAYLTMRYAEKQGKSFTNLCGGLE